MAAPGPIELLIIAAILLLVVVVPVIVIAIVVFFAMRAGRRAQEVVQTCRQCGTHVRGQPVQQCPNCGEPFGQTQ